MEAFGTFLDEEWESLSKLFSCEDSDFLLHFNGHGDLFPGGHETTAGVEESLCFPGPSFGANVYCISQESTNNSEADESALFAMENHQAANAVNFLQEVTTNTYESMGFCTMDSGNNDMMVPVFPDDEMEELLQLKAKMICNAQLGNARIQPPETAEEMQLKRKHDNISPEANSFDPTPKKRSRASNSRNNKRNTKLKKNKEAVHISNDEEENNGGSNGQSSSTCSSEEDDSNASQEQNGGSTSESKGSASNGKARANRGPATDPQSLYARRRRERINERLRILQNLVPNGTKVDISTMLEEAVHYVKFLQLQIKLLSSDDLWMYAPIAYNGMDIGVYQKIVPNLCLQN